MFSDRNIYDALDRFSKPHVELLKTFRMLWEQHDVWTRSAIASLVFDLPDVNAVVARLLRNPEDFEKALKPYYGVKIASDFRDLLKAHLTIAADLVKAAKAKDKKAVEETEKKWYANADEIAQLLAKINPYWSLEQWRMMLRRHLVLVESEAVELLNARYEDSIKTYDKIELQSLEMADEMAEGIIRQFNIN